VSLRWFRTTILALALIPPAAGCKEPERGLLIDGQRVPVIDMHLHPGEWSSIPPATQAFLASNFPFPFSTDPEGTAESILSPEGIASELDDAGISQAGLFAIYAPRTFGIADNELVETNLAAMPERFFGFASLAVDDWGNREAAELARLEQALGQPGMIGVKLAHAHQHFRMDDPAYYSIYVLAGQLDKPVYLHTGTSPAPGTSQDPVNTDPAFLEAAIVAHPQTIFILGHLGYDFINKQLGELETCIALAQRYENVYLEPSAMGSAFSDPDGTNLPVAMRRLREAGVVDRVIYGSDGPQRPGFVGEYLERTVEAMQGAGYTIDEIRAVLAGNFAELFGVPVPAL
jgi:predicted TIM-barrel fold metal-dependent hydrolase